MRNDQTLRLEVAAFFSVSVVLFALLPQLMLV